MKTAWFSGMVVAALAASFHPATAQERTAVAAATGAVAPAPRGWLARSVSREAARLGMDDATTSGSRTGQAGTEPSDWSRVARLAPGSEIAVTVKGAGTQPRRFVRADASEIVVLNLTDPALLLAVRRVLEDTATNHPERLEAVLAGGKTFMEQDVRLAPDGVFVAATKVADLQQILERITRDDILAIAVHASSLRPVKRSVKRGALIGGAIGIGLGVMAAVQHPEEMFRAFFVFYLGGLGAGIGAGTGAAIGFATREQVREVIYRAP